MAYYSDFKKFMRNNLHVFNDLSEFMDEYHYKPYLYNDYDIYYNITDCIYLDIDPIYLPNNIKDFNYLDYEYKSDMLNYIRNKELHELCIDWEYNVSKRNNDKLKNIYDMIIKFRNNKTKY